MDNIIACLTFGGGLAVLVGGALRWHNDKKVAHEKTLQEAAAEKTRKAEQTERDAAANRLAESRHRETAALFAARAELDTVREQLAAKSVENSAAKASIISSGEKVAALDDAITQALRDVSADTAAELRRQAEQLRWFAKGRKEAAEWNQALRPRVDRILQLIIEGAREASAKGLVGLVSETSTTLPHDVVYFTHDGPLEGLDGDLGITVKEFHFQKFIWVVRFTPGRVETSSAKEVRPHEMLSPTVTILSSGGIRFGIGFGNRDINDPTPMLVNASGLPGPVAERLTKVQEDYRNHVVSGDELISAALVEALKLSIVKADTSK